MNKIYHHARSKTIFTNRIWVDIIIKCRIIKGLENRMPGGEAGLISPKSSSIHIYKGPHNWGILNLSMYISGHWFSLIPADIFSNKKEGNMRAKNYLCRSALTGFSTSEKVVDKNFTFWRNRKKEEPTVADNTITYLRRTTVKCLRVNKTYWSIFTSTAGFLELHKHSGDTRLNPISFS